MSDDTSGTTTKRKRAEEEEESVPTTVAPEFAENWDQYLHRRFVEVVYEAGVQSSSPSIILENMSHRPASLTSERVKSHLQKYRKNRPRSKEEFMSDYDNFMVSHVYSSAKLVLISINMTARQDETKRAHQLSTCLL